MQQIDNLINVRFVGRPGGDRVHEAAVGVDRDVRLHLEVLLVALLGLMHLGIMFT